MTSVVLTLSPCEHWRRPHWAKPPGVIDDHKGYHRYGILIPFRTFPLEGSENHIIHIATYLGSMYVRRDKQLYYGTYQGCYVIRSTV